MGRGKEIPASHNMCIWHLFKRWNKNRGGPWMNLASSEKPRRIRVNGEQYNSKSGLQFFQEWIQGMRCWKPIQDTVFSIFAFSTDIKNVLLLLLLLFFYYYCLWLFISFMIIIILWLLFLTIISYYFAYIYYYFYNDIIIYDYFYSLWLLLWLLFLIIIID